MVIKGDKMGFLKKAVRRIYDDPVETKLTKKVSEKLDENLQKQIEKSNEKLELKVNEVAEKYDIRQGIDVTVITPVIEIITKNTSSDLMKTMATFSWGVAGYAMTSGKKTVEQNKKIKTKIKVVPKGIVFDKASNEGKDIRIPWDNIVKTSRDKAKYFNLHLIENQELKIWVKPISGDKNASNALAEYLARVINENATGVEEEGWN